jgi:hypothetical protein
MSYESEIAKGIKAEREHKSTIESLIADIQSGKVRKLSEYFKMIAEDHLKEMPDYYSRLAKMEQSAKKEPKAIALITIAKKPKE